MNNLGTSLLLLCMIVLFGQCIQLIDTCMSATTPSIKLAQIVQSTSNNKIIIEGKEFGASFNPMVFWDEASDTKALFPNDTSNVIPPLKWKVVKNMSYSNLTTVTNRNGKNDIVYYGKGGHCFIQHPRYQGNMIYDKLYASWWYRNTQDPSSEGDSNKFIRVWDEGNGYGTRISWTHMHLTCLNGTYWNSWSGKGKVHEWNHHEFYADLANHRVYATLNGRTIFNATCSKDSRQAGRPLYVELIGFDNGSDHYKNMTTAVDSIFIGNSSKRLVLSHNSTWTQIVMSEVMPIEEWTSTRIVARWIDGILNFTQPIYAYVVDENGNFNSQGQLVDLVVDVIPPLVSAGSSSGGGIPGNCTKCVSSAQSVIGVSRVLWNVMSLMIVLLYIIL